MAETITVFDGTTFCISDELGDLGFSETSGFWHDDVRHLSRLVLTIGGHRPQLLTSGAEGVDRAGFFLRNPVAAGLGPDTLLLSRRRSLESGMTEHIIVRNVSSEAISTQVDVELGAEFDDIFTVKTGSAGDRSAVPEVGSQENTIVFTDTGSGISTSVAFSAAGVLAEDRVFFAVELEPRGEWRLEISVVPATADGTPYREKSDAPTDELATAGIGASMPVLQRTFERSLADLRALRLHGDGPLDGVLGAGAPWFMTLFGRDTIITCLQTMMLGPRLAERSLHALAELQGNRDDAETECEPGKIIHELRRGKAAASWFERYYGTVDATPLFLILLSELWRWTADPAPVLQLQEPALRALRWIDEYGDRDGDGFVEYERRGRRGLENQSWKDSGDSQRFADGRFARPPIAPCEVQGYVFDAKLRTAELARAVWGDPELADRLELEAEALARRFQEHFWIEQRGGYYALALDHDKKPVDAMCSNMGQLLWSGIVPAERVDTVVAQLVGNALWSGWGIRTMSREDAAYNPIGYHTGTVWPHDVSLIAWGLARCGRRAELEQVARAMLEAASGLDGQLPEVFSGLSRAESPFPVDYPTAARPQAWAAATPILLLRLVLGLEPDPSARALTSRAPSVPSWLGDIELSVQAFGSEWEVKTRSGSLHLGEPG